MREMEVVTLGAADGLVGPRAVPKEAAAEGVKHAAAHAECLNCGAVLHGRYCADCGQADDDHHRSIFHLLWEAVEGLTHLDGRLAKTLPPLFLNPGKLARDHFEGRRQRHVPPFRLFLITLLIFMFSLEFVFHHASFGDHGATPAAAGAARLGQSLVAKDSDGRAVTVHLPSAAELAGMTGGRVSAEDIQREVDAERVAAAKAGGGEDKPAAGPSAKPSARAQRNEARLGWLKRQALKIRENPELFKSLMFEWGHRLAVLMLPIFALLLTACYFYKRQFYVYDHLVVAMHFLSFTFLLWAVIYVIPSPVNDWLVLVGVLWTPVNLYMTLRGAYGSGRLGAGVKAFGLWIASMVLFTTLLLGVLGVAIGQL